MLLITRREGEALVINGAIEVRILEIRGGRVKLGIEYPVGNTVFRQELFAKIQAENRAAAATQTNTQSLKAALGNLGQNKGSEQIGTEDASGKGKQKGPNHADPLADDE